MWVAWAYRAAMLAVVFWWPAVVVESLYSPRVLRLEGLRYSMPDGSEVQSTQDRAIAMFWAWRERAIVRQRVSLGPLRGVRHEDGWSQSVFVVACIWLAKYGLCRRSSGGKKRGVGSNGFFAFGQKDKIG